ncbi:MAG: DUF2851 family protein [Pedobacter sp.]|nr:DUF2851 family protein [Chitinophagaceae bacterium]
MNEKLLQFIWQFQYFNNKELFTDNAESLTIIKPGSLNSNQGPDFSDAIIQIDNVRLAGNIEVHFKASDWVKHHHETDINYNNIILHVVWVNDAAIATLNKHKISTLVLEGRVPKITLERYLLMMETPFIPCQNIALPTLNELGWISWKERLIAERLERKSNKVLELLEQSKQHWEAVFWIMLAANFGMKVNSELFEAVAQSITINILAKHKNQIHQIEALLLGQANLLVGDFSDDYAILLQKEYQFLQKKYQLQPITIQPNYLRMRPANFPTIRLAQLAMLIHNSLHLFSKIKEQKNIKEVKSLFEVRANDYWHYHYQFDKPTDYSVKFLGADTLDNLIINTVVPVLFAYGLHMQDEAIKDKAIKWLMDIKNETNHIIKEWRNADIACVSAFDSQALIELTNSYCNKKSCLKCAVGNKIFKVQEFTT